MPLYGDTSLSRPSQHAAKAEQNYYGEIQLTLEDVLDLSLFETAQEAQATRPSSPATESTRATATESTDEGRPSFAPSQRVPGVISNVVERLSAINRSRVGVDTKSSHWSYVPPSYHLLPPPPHSAFRLSCQRPSLIPPFPSEAYFDRHNWRIKLPCAVVAILRISECTHTVYFTSPDRVFSLPVAASTRVVYAIARRHPHLDIDLLDDNISGNWARALSEDVWETCRRLRELNSRLMRHRQQQDVSMRNARLYSDARIRARRARGLVRDADATSLIPGVPYFESYISELAFDKACAVEDVVKVFEPPSLSLRFVV
ncbi:uncharacterized protein SCHCODRAFT_02098425 [Schizophyllum commune H4-8]|uniref:uncharacterized protein n=1 Tax=Schizophyllum commune (strain H4-8 / FGSC 9210) TaxID=578458 RepID=UPI0021610B35|nr:uncharacterized protein SCHCODRAFT_02098425 [Schizophyllum commune H4-8]KAI5886427.1 hypothetical protein SCHCODRAFT_02098425 [Schizophyllum commune H4-8]